MSDEVLKDNKKKFNPNKRIFSNCKTDFIQIPNFIQIVIHSLLEMPSKHNQAI